MTSTYRAMQVTRPGLLELVERETQAGVQAGDLVAVEGGGGLGHPALQYARRMGIMVVALGRGIDIADDARASAARIP